MIGRSMGGQGTWEYAERHGNKLAAIVTLAGGGGATDCTHLINLPIWAFHNDGDPVIPVTATIDRVGQIKEAGGNPQMTIFDIDAHKVANKDAYTRALFDWLFAQSLAADEVASPQWVGA